MKNDSACRKSVLCRFEKSRDLPDALIEVCVNCGKKVIYNKRDGNVDDAKYLRDHLRDFAQPFGRTAKIFERIYGKAAVARMRSLPRRKSKDQLREEFQEVTREAKRAIRRQYV
jgi:hypothetical protein